MHSLLSDNRDELIARCKAKVARRPRRAATAQQLANGIPLFLEQLASTLRAEGEGNVAEGVRISGPAGGMRVRCRRSVSAQRPTARNCLSIARRTIEADGGSLTVRNMPGTGCVFTVSLPGHSL